MIEGVVMEVKEFYIDLIGMKEKLEDQLDFIDKELGLIYKKWKQVMTKYENGDYSEDQLENIKQRLAEKIERLSNNKGVISEKIDRVKNKIKRLDNACFEIIEGINVDILKYCKDMNFYYYDIYLHDSDQKIGYIEYRKNKGDPHNGYRGDIGYRIDEGYRGKGYASEALILLTDKLYKDGINNVYIAINNDNLSSIRVAEKFGGKLMSEFSDDKYNLYKCDLKEIKKVSKK